jgi:hypothetical protein
LKYVAALAHAPLNVTGAATRLSLYGGVRVEELDDEIGAPLFDADGDRAGGGLKLLLAIGERDIARGANHIREEPTAKVRIIGETFGREFGDRSRSIRGRCDSRQNDERSGEKKG